MVTEGQNLSPLSRSSKAFLSVPLPQPEGADRTKSSPLRRSNTSSTLRFPFVRIFVRFHASGNGFRMDCAKYNVTRVGDDHRSGTPALGCVNKHSPVPGIGHYPPHGSGVRRNHCYDPVGVNYVSKADRDHPGFHLSASLRATITRFVHQATSVSVTAAPGLLGQTLEQSLLLSLAQPLHSPGFVDPDFLHDLLRLHLADPGQRPQEI